MVDKVTSTRATEYPKTQQWDIGLVLIHDFITPDEESTMIAAFHKGLEVVDPTTTTKSKSKTGRRKRVSQHFGHHFDYTTFGASTTSFTPVPEYILSLLPRLPTTTQDSSSRLPDQFTTQWYPPSAGIPPHVDTHSLFAEALYSLSFGSDVPMSFRKVTPADARRMRLPKRSLMSEAELEASRTDVNHTEHEETERCWEILLPRRSLLVMTGAARYGYTHGIRARKTDVIDGKTVPRQDRYSLTMRTVRRGDEIGCHCEFPDVCDARIREEMASMS